MKRFRRVMFVLMSVLLIMSFVACSEDEGDDGGDGTTYTVTYNGNGNSGGVVPTSSGYTNGQQVTVSGNIGSLVKLQDGISMSLVGWNTQADGNGVNYRLGTGTFTMGSANVTLYAKWSTSVLRAIGPAGGLVFYDKGSYSDGWRYLEAAPVSTEWTNKQWGSFPSEITGTVTNLGSG